MQSFFTICQNKNTSRRQNLDIGEPHIVILRRECENNAKNMAQCNTTWLFTPFFIKNQKFKQSLGKSLIC